MILKIKIYLCTKLKIENILFPTDLSELSKSALKTAVAICKRQHAKLTLLHVEDNISLNIRSKSYVFDEKRMIDFFNQVYKETKISQQFQLEVKTIVEKGNPADVICNVANEGGYSIIVIGANGASGIGKKTGSTAFSVVKNAPCPVLIVPGDWERQNFKKIIYPIRMDQKVFEKYNYIESIIEKNNSELIIAGLADKNEPEQIKEAVFSIDLLRNMCEEDKIPYSTVILPCNNFATKIIDKANIVNADLIVISSHIDYDSKENFIGYFAQDIVNQSKCPVLSISPLLNK